MITATLLGSSGAIPRPRQPLTSLFIKSEQFSALVDCGEGTQISAMNFGADLYGMTAIFITHEHFDHTLGISGLVSTLKNLKRTEPLFIFVPKSSYARFTNLIKVTTSSYSFESFDVIVIPLEGDHVVIRFGDVTVTAFKVNHTVPCYGYKFVQMKPGRFQQDKAEALNMDNRYYTLLQNGYYIQDGNKMLTVDDICNQDGCTNSLLYCTDTRPCESLLKQACGVDLAVMEGMYWGEEFRSQALENRHSLCSESIAIAKEAGVKELWLTHFSPSFCNAHYVLRSVESDFPIRAGKSGLQKEIDNKR